MGGNSPFPRTPRTEIPLFPSIEACIMRGKELVTLLPAFLCVLKGSEDLTLFRYLGKEPHVRSA